MSLFDSFKQKVQETRGQLAAEVGKFRNRELMAISMQLKNKK